MTKRRRSCAGILALSLCALAAPSVAAPWIDMGHKDEFAFDQPYVSIELFQQLANGGKGSSLGPHGSDFFGYTNQFLLDTGATSIIAMNDAENELRDNGYITENIVYEQGVAGFSELDVSAEYYFELSDSSGAVNSLPFTRIMSGEFEDLFGINGLVGMPGMVGKVVTLDTSVWAEVEDILDLVPMDVHIASTLPATGGHRYSVPIVAREFHVLGEAPLPVEAPIPMLDMSVGFGNADASGSFILDTGASISFMSPALGLAIDLDSNDDGLLNELDEQCDGSLPIGGIGGTVEAPLFYIDRFTVRTDQGVDLVWNLEQSLSVLILDIHPDIDGVLGSDLLTSGWFSFTEEEEEENTPGPLQQIHFDFRQFLQEGDLGKIYFDLTPSVDVVQPGVSGDINGDGSFDVLDFVLWQKNGGTPEEYEDWANNFSSEPGSVSGDVNGDGHFDALDYVLWQKNGGTTEEYQAWQSNYGVGQPGSGTDTGLATAVPEPGTLALISLAACVFAPSAMRFTRRGARSAASSRSLASCSS